jgi:hypothetical protein
MQECYRKTSNRALRQVIYFVGVRRFGEAQPESKRLAQGKLVDAILPGGLLPASKSTLIQ